MPHFTSRQGAALLAACLGLTACGDDSPGPDVATGLTGVVPAATGTTPATTNVPAGDGGVVGSEGGATAGDTGGFDLGGFLGDGGLEGLLDASLPDAATADAATSDASTADASSDDDAGTLDDASTPDPADASVAEDAGPSDDGGTDTDAGPSTPGFPPVGDLGENGPFETNGTLGDAEGPNCTIYRPATLGEGGLKHPVILWGMGTGGFNTYQDAYELWASHGFIVAAGLSGNGQGSGEEMLGCLDYVCEEYAPHVDCHAGAAGHSQGGGGALMAGRDPRVITTAPVQPYILFGLGGFETASIGQQKGPMLLMSGTLDTVATPADNQQPVFDDTNVPVFWANAVGADHVGIALDGLAAYRALMLAWFRLHLMGDESFRDMFYGDACTACDDDAFEVQRKGMD